MITAGQALMIALAASVQQLGQQPAGNAFVELRDAIYWVSLIPATSAAPGAPKSGEAVLVKVDHDTGDAAAPGVAADGRRPERSPDVSSISIAAAYDHAIAALRGFDNYDKQARLSVVLRNDHYEVTFPPIVTAPVSRGIDYAYQVWVDAASGGIVKILVPS